MTDQAFDRQLDIPRELRWFAKDSEIERPLVSRNECHFSAMFKNVSTTSKMD